ncbi:hypothetical protein CBL_11975 [Carabus blaptoides fortunei]
MSGNVDGRKCIHFLQTHSRVFTSVQLAEYIFRLPVTWFCVGLVHCVTVPDASTSYQYPIISDNGDDRIGFRTYCTVRRCVATSAPLKTMDDITERTFTSFEGLTRPCPTENQRTVRHTTWLPHHHYY